MSDSKEAHWKIVPLVEGHDVGSFDCGVPPLNEFVHKNVRRNTKQHYGRTFVAESLPSKGKTIAGYYTISMTSISFLSLPRKLSRSLPKYPVPAALIGRLAVDKEFHGKGLGSVLLIDALKRIAALAETEIGCAAVLVDAKDEQAKQFYLKYGFIPLEDSPQRLFLPMKTITKLFS